MLAAPAPCVAFGFGSAAEVGCDRGLGTGRSNTSCGRSNACAIWSSFLTFDVVLLLFDVVLLLFAFIFASSAEGGLYCSWKLPSVGEKISSGFGERVRDCSCHTSFNTIHPPLL